MEKQESLWVAKPLKLAGARNVRDLGGYPAEDDGTVQSGRFYRGDSTAGLTGEDVRLLQQLGVGCVVDLRSGQETERAPSALRETPGVDYYAAPMLDQVTSSAYQGSSLCGFWSCSPPTGAGPACSTVPPERTVPVSPPCCCCCWPGCRGKLL